MFEHGRRQHRLACRLTRVLRCLRGCEPTHTQGKFGTTGKFKVEFPPTGLCLTSSGSSRAGQPSDAKEHQAQQQQRSTADNVLVLRFKRFLFDPHAKQKLQQ
jgi:hypothetical protein